MANYCEVDMRICGEKENVEKFIDALTLKGNTYIGRGINIHIGSEGEFDEEDNSIQILGQCKWSLESSLVTKVREIRLSNPEKEVLTIEEACKKFHVNCEAFTEEPGCCFAEHFIYEFGEGEWDVCHYSEDYDEKKGEYVANGGFYHDFQISAPEDEEIEL